MADEQQPELDNDQKIAQGLLTLYTRFCDCGEKITFNDLPHPTKCPKCLKNEQDNQRSQEKHDGSPR